MPMPIVRKYPAHPPALDAFNQPVVVFLTVCSKGRKAIFAFPDAHAQIVDAWRAARSWIVGRYVVMPDHVHLFCASATLAVQPLAQWVRYWKNLASRKWPRRTEQPIWQRDFWDRQLRRDENYDSKWQYICENPVRAGLVASSTDWPFQGELNVLHW
jgi:putative transposase